MIDPAYRNRVYLITPAGAQQSGFPGAAFVRRINKEGDIVGNVIGNNGPIARTQRIISGQNNNDSLVRIPRDHSSELIPPFGLQNHSYTNNYNEAVAEIISEILNQ